MAPASTRFFCLPLISCLLFSGAGGAQGDTPPFPRAAADPVLWTIQTLSNAAIPYRGRPDAVLHPRFDQWTRALSTGRTLRQILLSLGDLDAGAVFKPIADKGQPFHGGLSGMPFRLHADGLRFFQELLPGAAVYPDAFLVMLHPSEASGAAWPYGILWQDLELMNYYFFNILPAAIPRSERFRTFLEQAALYSQWSAHKALQALISNKPSFAIVQVIKLYFDEMRGLLYPDHVMSPGNKHSCDFQDVIVANLEIFRGAPVREIGTGTGVLLPYFLNHGASWVSTGDLMFVHVLIAYWNIHFMQDRRIITPAAARKVSLTQADALQSLPHSTKDVVVWNAPAIVRAQTWLERSQNIPTYDSWFRISIEAFSAFFEGLMRSPFKYAFLRIAFGKEFNLTIRQFLDPHGLRWSHARTRDGASLDIVRIAG